MGLWVFDLDGTLVTSNIDYGYAVSDFIPLMLDVFNHRAPHYSVIIELVGDFDRERFKTMRADRKRFPGSLVETYLEICRRTGTRPDLEIEDLVWEIGYSALLSEETHRVRGMIPGAEEVLTFLQEQGNPLYCVTFGDKAVQWMKWRGYNLRRFFPTPREFRPVKYKKLDTLRAIRARHPDGPAFMVGDSIESDLIPAAEAGYRPIYIPAPSVWDHGELKGEDKIPPGTIRLERIVEIRDSFYDSRG